MATAMKDMLANAPRAEAIPALGALSGRSPMVEIVVPVFNEERDLGRSVRRLLAYLLTPFPFTFRITIADNASTDGTWAIASGLAERLPNVSAVRVSEKGRGRALHQVWSKSHATVLAYMDVDLSTDLAALLPLVAPLLSGHSDLAIGTRLSRSARVTRGGKRCSAWPRASSIPTTTWRWPRPSRRWRGSVQ